LLNLLDPKSLRWVPAANGNRWLENLLVPLLLVFMRAKN